MAEFQEVMKEAGRCCAFYKHNCEACSLTNVCPTRFYIDKYINVGNDAYFEKRVMDWVKEHPEPVYPTWGEWLESIEVIKYNDRADSIDYLIRPTHKTNTRIPADIAQKLGITPKENN